MHFYLGSIISTVVLPTTEIIEPLKSKYNLVCLSLYFAQVMIDISELLGNFTIGY